jgi:hypothetical protein
MTHDTGSPYEVNSYFPGLEISCFYDSSSCLQKPTTGPYHELDQSSSINSHRMSLQTHFNITIPSTPRSPKWSLPFRVSGLKFYMNFITFCMCAACPTKHVLNLINHYWVKSMNYLVPSYVLPITSHRFDPNSCSPLQLVLKHHESMLFHLDEKLMFHIQT